MMWVCEPPDGGRGMGFTGGHTHAYWGNPGQRKVVLNALLWLAKAEVPANGVESTVSEEDLKANLDAKANDNRWRKGVMEDGSITPLFLFLFPYVSLQQSRTDHHWTLAALSGGVFVGKTYFVNIYKIPQNGMYPTIKPGGIVLARLHPYKDASAVRRGDVIVFKQVEEGDVLIQVWRVIGLPGDQIKFLTMPSP